jgi:hypothetical protein
MERAVMPRDRVRLRPYGVTRSGRRDGERESGRQKRVSMPVEVGLQELGGRRRFDGSRGRSGRRHAGRGSAGETRLPCNCQHDREDETSCQTQDVASPPPHHPSLTETP